MSSLLLDCCVLTNVKTAATTATVLFIADLLPLRKRSSINTSAEPTWIQTAAEDNRRAVWVMAEEKRDSIQKGN